MSDWGRKHHRPRAILHIDGDAFFASCEQAVNPELKGKPVVTGKERGIISAASYEAKALGIKRGVPLWEVKKICPEAIILPSDYETYSLFSKRMFAIMRRFSAEVEEYGIDEGFMDITGLQRPLNASYEQIARQIKDEIQQELDITVSVGLGTTKVLAKIGSKHQKPNGLTVVAGNNILPILKQTPASAVWGIGPSTTAHMKKLGINTAFDFYNKNELYVRRHFAKPYFELWQELHGHYVLQLVTTDKTTYDSISKTKTFTPPTNNRQYLFAQLLKNLENACIKARRYNLVTQKLIIYLRLNNFSSVALEVKLACPTAFPSDLINITQELFASLYKSSHLYRATGVVLSHLKPMTNLQLSLFESPLAITKNIQLYQAIDNLSAKYGKHTIYHAAAHQAHVQSVVTTDRHEKSWRQTNRLKGESARKHLRVPFISQTLN